MYGRGLIGEETGNAFKTYHFDCRGSTVALTNASGVITDTFAYDTYGGLISRTGTSSVIFLYNGRDGVVTDTNGLIYMRARYYSPDMRRFVNADIVAGAISEAVTLNRFAYANGNPVSNIDPFGLSADDRTTVTEFTGHCGNVIIITDFSLPVVGHSELYFLDEDGRWFKTEFNLHVKYDNIFETIGNKDQAYVTWEQIYTHPKEGYFPNGFYAVEITGNFDKSVELAQYYAEDENKFFNGYNLFVNNCADYTETLLDVADVEGMCAQIIIAEDTFLTIPVVRTAKAALAKELDTGVTKLSDAIKCAGNYTSSIGCTVLGNALNELGEGVVVAADSIGSMGTKYITALDRIKQDRKDTAAYIIKTVSDSIDPFWDWLASNK